MKMSVSTSNLSAQKAEKSRNFGLIPKIIFIIICIFAVANIVLGVGVIFGGWLVVMPISVLLEYLKSMNQPALAYQIIIGVVGFFLAGIFSGLSAIMFFKREKTSLYFFYATLALDAISLFLIVKKLETAICLVVMIIVIIYTTLSRSLNIYFMKEQDYQTMLSSLDHLDEVKSPQNNVQQVQAGIKTNSQNPMQASYPPQQNQQNYNQPYNNNILQQQRGVQQPPSQPQQNQQSPNSNQQPYNNNYPKNY